MRTTTPWLLLYLLLILVPPTLSMWLDAPAGRGLWIDVAIGLGFVGLAMFVVQFALTARFRSLATPIGLDAMMRFHKWMGLLAATVIFAHPLILIWQDPAHLAFFDPRVNLRRAVALAAALLCLSGVVGLPFLKRPLGVPYAWWRLTHGVMAAFVVLIGLVHINLVGYYTAVFWKQLMWAVLILSALALLVSTRVLKPWQIRRVPWSVAKVLPEREGVWTLTLDPEGHKGLRFRAGQFVWLTIDQSPFALEQHPFSISSSEDHPERIEITIKHLGDYTSHIGQIKLGSRAYVDGPYGTFTLPDDPNAPIVFIAGGIGITPMMSMIRTLHDRSDRRRLLLIYGSKTLDKVTFHDDLDRLTSELALQVELVIEQPPEDWVGERGYVDLAVLQKHLLPPFRHAHVYICGPDLMMTNARHVLRAIGFTSQQISMERFNMM